MKFQNNFVNLVITKFSSQFWEISLLLEIPSIWNLKSLDTQLKMITFEIDNKERNPGDTVIAPRQHPTTTRMLRSHKLIRYDDNDDKSTLANLPAHLFRLLSWHSRLHRSLSSTDFGDVPSRRRGRRRARRGHARRPSRRTKTPMLQRTIVATDYQVAVGRTRVLALASRHTQACRARQCVHKRDRSCLSRSCRLGCLAHLEGQSRQTSTRFSARYSSSRLCCTRNASTS